jgi:hypothetical protein
VRALLSREESVALVRRMLGGAITPTVFRLADGSLEARLTVDPEIAVEALREGPA